jgi:DtxR family Mn-dependent transcriptional regulator
MTGADQYLLAVYIESRRCGPSVSPGTVAERLDRSAPSVTEMFHQLDDRGLVSYDPYEGATLTAAGWDRAAKLHESYVAISWFFRSVLELDEHESEAMELAGVADPDVVARIAELLPVDEPEDGLNG